MEPVDVQLYAKNLADAVERQWRDVNFQNIHFPDIAATALADNPFPDGLNGKSLFRYGFFFNDKAHQSNPDYPFGDPPLILCRRELFEVGVLFWLDGTTAIHQHSFSGAFQVLAGESLHSTYGFKLQETINERLLLGDLENQTHELLRRRAIRKIVAGPTFIHSLFHLSRPSITLLIRTHFEPSWGPQLNYSRAGVAVDPFHRPPEKILRQRLFKSLVSLTGPEECGMLEEILRESDLESSLGLLIGAAGWLRDKNLRPDPFINAAIGNRSDIRNRVRAFLEEEIRTQNITGRRRLIRDSEHRFFLALLLNFSNRKSILDAIREYEGDGTDPVEKITHWVEDLTGLAVGSENHLEIDFNYLKLFVLEGLMRDLYDTHLVTFVLERLHSKNLSFSEKDFQIALFVLPELRIFKPLFVV